VHIGVTFIIGADGILAVRAQDLETLQEQSIRINLIGGMQEEEIERMQQRHASLFSEQATGPHG
jgi:molecular chaperone DnaK (HSP70)